MIAATKLVDALTSVDWTKNVNTFCKDESSLAAISAPGLKLAIWSRQFENLESENPAICFVREMQAAGHLVASSTALAIYRSAAAAMRTVLESALYYSYYRSHPVELATLLRRGKWYLSKTEILEYHVTHTPRFGDFQHKVGLLGDLEKFYSKISAIVHGQIPGVWVQPVSIASTKHNAALVTETINCYVECVEIVNRFFLCTVGHECWDYFSTPSKRALTKGISGEVKTHLGLDTA